uniref:Major facilitator superfamily (MFS) profile domain-containing protein n=1 Tax=Coccolithus braarudii TaxID=221442 RepID=A0A7S0Q2F5_9EUKA
MSLLLAVVPNDDVPKIVALTETFNKIGSVLFTVVVGLTSYVTYPDVSFVFYILGGAGITAAVCVLLIPPATMDDSRARQLCSGSNDSAMSESSPLRYRELFRNRNIVIFGLLTFLYHLSNAGITPLVAQLIAREIENERKSLLFASLALCIFYCVQAVSTYIVGRTYKRFSYKTLLLLAILILPIRCSMLAFLTMFAPNEFALVSTQIFEGVGAGIYDTLMPLVVKRLVEGTGHYGFTYGFILTCWRIGHALSVLLGEFILKESSYEVAFFTLGGLGVLVAAVFLFCINIPPASPCTHHRVLPAGSPSPSQSL